MTPEEQKKLYATDYGAWISWKLKQPGEFATEAEAQAVADEENHKQTRDLFYYSPSPNRNGGWDVGAASCDG
jgi:hypothetical protein